MKESDKKTTTEITLDDIINISKHLEESNCLFRTFWEIGLPIISNSIPTACIAFDEDGNETSFLFNGEYWDSIDEYTRTFVVAHEMLHILLHHGKRMKLQNNDKLSNMSMDIVINHLLVDGFKFDRSKINNQENICWVDTCFPEDVFGIIESNRSYEYYYNLMLQNSTQVVIKELVDFHGNPQNTENVIDDKYTLDDIKSIIDELKKYITPEDLKDIKDVCDIAGLGSGIWESFKLKDKVKVKKKWETIIKSWKKKTFVYDENTFDSFIKENRRFVDFLNDDICLQTEVDMEDYFLEKNAVEIWFFLDYSGSCASFKDRFLNASRTLNENKFKIKLFTFDDKVNEVDLKNNKIYGGGGTRFDIIETYIQNSINSKSISYPDCVFLITDGKGNSVYPKHPERWFWFLTENNNKKYINSKSHIYNLSDFE